MRIRNVKNKKDIIDSCSYVIFNPEENFGKWNNVFNNSNEIEIEIGMGKGKFILEKALLNPNINYIGIEKYDSIIARAIEKIPYGIDNLKLIRMDALNIDKVFDHEVSKIYLNFSDPWPKKRHAQRRLTSSIFLDKYDKIFKDRKVIEQKTDNPILFEYSIISLNNNNYKIEDISLDLHKRDVNNVTTEYEEKFSRNGNSIYYIKAKK
ncbi:MAG: tRNA (guanosine(46)-N7)-methyltransferase TrmB [bacterium]|nr:tRNA (guanosine(46)-N7)-methyltransferase TrmB [bacterium]